MREAVLLEPRVAGHDRPAVRRTSQNPRHALASGAPQRPLSNTGTTRGQPDSRQRAPRHAEPLERSKLAAAHRSGHFTGSRKTTSRSHGRTTGRSTTARTVTLHAPYQRPINRSRTTAHPRRFSAISGSRARRTSPHTGGGTLRRNLVPHHVDQVPRGSYEPVFRAIYQPLVVNQSNQHTRFYLSYPLAEPVRM